MTHHLNYCLERYPKYDRRVRNNLAKNFSDVANVLGIKGNDAFVQEQNMVMACFVAILTDSEAEVRSAAVTHLSRMIAWGGPKLYQHHIQALLPALADDAVMEVRSKCALALMDTAAAPDNALEDTMILQHFGPLYEAFLQDEFHEVQLQVLCNLHKIAHLLPGLSGVVTTLLQMSKATNWRVREAVARLLPHLAEARGLDFFNTVLLEPAWLPLLLDPVACVRNSIVSGMALLVRVVGPEYVLSTLLPHHIRIFNQSSHTYLIRVTIVNAHIETALACQSVSPLWPEVMTQIVRGLSDRVPNVRTITARGLARIVQLHKDDGHGDEAYFQTQVRPALEKCLADETDVECRPACQFALDQIQH
jgi:serine/threonine-protein phosphatase 2A regulatory subunit A